MNTNEAQKIWNELCNLPNITDEQAAQLVEAIKVLNEKPGLFR